MFRTTLLSSSLQTCLGSGAAAHRAQVGRSLVLPGTAAPQISVTHVAEPVNVPYRYIDDPGKVSQVGRFHHYAAKLTEDALEHSMLDVAGRKRTGVFLGSSSFIVGQSESRLTSGEAGNQAIVFDTAGQGKLSRYIKRRFNLGGPDFAYSTGCTSSANAMLSAYRMLADQVIDHALILGLEFFSETTLLGFSNLGLLASNSLLPFDDKRDGLVLGEAGAALVLSREAKQDCLQLCGGATGTDTQSLTSANPDGSTIAATLQRAMAHAGIGTQDIRAIKTHGTGSPMSDEAEARGISRVFEVTPPLVALKPAIGHTLGASGAVEFALWAHCLDNGTLPANTGIAGGNTKSGVSLNQQAEELDGGHHLLNYFSFGGNNTVLVCYRV